MDWGERAVLRREEAGRFFLFFTEDALGSLFSLFRFFREGRSRITTSFARAAGTVFRRIAELEPAEEDAPLHARITWQVIDKRALALIVMGATPSAAAHLSSSFRRLLVTTGASTP